MAADKAYGLLADAMEESGKAGIARFVTRDKEYLVTIIAEDGLLRAQTMRFHDEVRTPEDVWPEGLRSTQMPARSIAWQALSRR